MKFEVMKTFLQKKGDGTTVDIVYCSRFMYGRQWWE